MRIVRLVVWLAGALGALVGFVALGALTPHRLVFGDVGGWLSGVSLQDALVELARWSGIVLAVYVLAVAVLVLLAEVAVSVRAVPLARWLHGLADLVAVPALRRRLVGASMSAVITVSAGMASIGGRAFAAVPVVQTVGMSNAAGAIRDVLPAGVSSADLVGFGFDSSAIPGLAPGAVQVSVARGDTMWDLAVAHYGFCDRSIIDLVTYASGINDPDLIFVGQTLVLPPLSSAAPQTPSTAATPAPSPSIQDPSAADSTAWAIHTIVHGDTLWDIVDAEYGHATAELVSAVARYNRIENPSAIPIGTEVTLPPLLILRSGRTSADPTAAAPTPVSDPAPPADEAPAPTVVAGPAPAAQSPSPATVDVPAPVTDSPAPPPVSDEPADPVATSTPAGQTLTSGPSFSGVAETAARPVEPWLAGLAGGTTLAAGLLLVYRRLRRRQRSAGARAWRLMPSGQSARLYRQLVSAADLPLVRWAGQEISGLLFGLGNPAAGPVAVELSDLSGIELLWDAPMPDAPAPWEATPGGWSWRLLYDPAAEVPESVLPAAIPGLVTIGRRHDAQVLIDLEAFGSVSIAGDPRAVEDLVRSIVLELGSGEELSDAWVSTIGLGVDGVEHLSRVQVREDSEALEHAHAVVDDVKGVMADAHVAGTFELRTSGPATTREVTVIAARADSCTVLDELVTLATPRSGLAVIVVGAFDNAGLDLVVDAAGCVQVASLGMTVETAGVSHEAAANAAVLLDAAAEMVTVEDLCADSSDESLPESSMSVSSVDLASVTEMRALCGSDGVDLVAAGNLLSDHDVAEWHRPRPALTVRVLGKPRLEPGPDRFGRFERLVVVYVTAMGGAAASNTVRDAVWSGSAISDKRFWNVVGHIRAIAGAEICPARAVGPRAGVVQLHGTSTDLHMLEGLVAQAQLVPSSQALELLLEGLGLVYGEAFDDVGYEWAIDAQLTSKAALLIESAALRAVELALAADDVLAARTALSHALLGLPGNELLYRARMRIEAHVGNRAGVRSVYAELLTVLGDLSTHSGDTADPSPATRQLFEQLLEGSRKE